MTLTQDLESEIRDFVNDLRRKAILMKDGATWGMCCSSLDAIGDTELALESYVRDKPREERARRDDTGSVYTAVYGILQVLYVQQDAVKNLATALGFQHLHSQAIKDIREIRNAAVGHPTHQNHARPAAFNFIARITMFRGGFRMMTLRADGSTNARNVDIAALIRQQQEEVGKALREIFLKLKEDEMAHRKLFRDKKLAALFPATLGHTHEKVSEAISRPDMHDFGAAMLAAVTECVDNFKADLAARGVLDGSDFVAHAIGELERPTARLRDYFTRPDSGLTQEDAHVFHFFIQEKVNQLGSLAAEIDTEYDKDA